ncbi:DUF1646 family protein [Caldanaerobacter subterraneus]|uniref:DUF1646 family protein n=1 Tax=Caldanaerobacter subterraneus TaxID=911092 RepID=UPI003C7E6420
MAQPLFTQLYRLNCVEKITDEISLRLFAFIIIVVLGLMSGIITAIIASLVLVEVVNYLPLSRKNKINLICHCLFLHRFWCCFNACRRTIGYYCCI